jgi:hypothetical protein
MGMAKSLETLACRVLRGGCHRTALCSRRDNFGFLLNAIPQSPKMINQANGPLSRKSEIANRKFAPSHGVKIEVVTNARLSAEATNEPERVPLWMLF